MSNEKSKIDLIDYSHFIRVEPIEILGSTKSIFHPTNDDIERYENFSFDGFKTGKFDEFVDAEKVNQVEIGNRPRSRNFKCK